MSLEHLRKPWLLALGGALAFAAVLAFDEEGWRKRRRLGEDVAVLRAENERLAADNARLALEARALRTDPAAIERAAREELRLVRPGEIVYRLDAEPGGAP
jgi:cell division protein FtsB